MCKSMSREPRTLTRSSTKKLKIQQLLFLLMKIHKQSLKYNNAIFFYRCYLAYNNAKFFTDVAWPGLMVLFDTVLASVICYIETIIVLFSVLEIHII